jgi:N-acetylmuramoyl-L-alanine amidase
MYRIYLSPSNQTTNEGVSGYNEAKQMHRLAERVKQHLLYSIMFEVRVSDSTWDLEQVTMDSNNWKSDLHVCLHSDAGPAAAQGTTAFILATGGNAQKFADIFYKKIAPLSPGPDRNVNVRPGLYELRKTVAPAVLIENFFHTNAEEVSYFETHFEEYAKQTALAIYEFFAIPYPIKEHWAEPYYKILTEVYKIDIKERDFDRNITRGEILALICKVLKSDKL